jgi:hypothetical protein
MIRITQDSAKDAKRTYATADYHGKGQGKVGCCGETHVFKTEESDELRSPTRTQLHDKRCQTVTEADSCPLRPSDAKRTTIGSVH